MRHFYRLILRVKPGGSRKHVEWVVGTLDEAKEFLREDLESGQGAYHALWYGEEIVLECWADRELLSRIDLHPYITYRLGDRDEIACDESGGAVDGDPDREESEAEAEVLAQAVLEESVAISVRVEWDKVPVPKLAGTPLAPGEQAEIREEDGSIYSMDYGENELSG